MSERIEVGPDGSARRPVPGGTQQAAPQLLGSSPETALQVVGAQQVDSVPVEVQRIMRTGTIWTAAGMLTAVLGLGPLVASGWRPMDLPGGVEAMFWIGTLVATVGLGLLMWAGCPVMAYTVEKAYWQKKHSVRIGICMHLVGMALVGLAIITTPVS